MLENCDFKFFTRFYSSMKSHEVSSRRMTTVTFIYRVTRALREFSRIQSIRCRQTPPAAITSKENRTRLFGFHSSSITRLVRIPRQASTPESIAMRSFSSGMEITLQRSKHRERYNSNFFLMLASFHH